MTEQRPLCAHTFGLVWSGPVGQVVEQLHERGFRDCELLAMAPHLDPWAFAGSEVRALRARMERFGGRVLSIDLPSTDYNLASPSPTVVDFAVAAYERVIEIAADLGAKWVTVNPGRAHPLLPPPDGRLRVALVRTLERLGNDASKRGVRLLLENVAGSLLPTGTSVERFLMEFGLGDVDVVYDVANAWTEREDPVLGLSALGARVKVVHFSDARQGVWGHLPIGQGDVPFSRALSAAAGPSVDHWVLEISGGNPLGDLVAGRDILTGHHPGPTMED